jgi:hypothetical protein
VAVAGDRAYVADHNAGLRILNISEPSAPDEIAFYDTPGQAHGVAAVGEVAYVADAEGGLFILTQARYIYLPLVLRNTP